MTCSGRSSSPAMEKNRACNARDVRGYSYASSIFDPAPRRHTDRSADCHLRPGAGTDGRSVAVRPRDGPDGPIDKGRSVRAGQPQRHDAGPNLLEGPAGPGAAAAADAEPLPESDPRLFLQRDA